MKFRLARHVKSLKPMVDFYCGTFGFTVLGSFKNHAGYDGVFLGIKGNDWHLEFTASNKLPLSVVDEDDALVFYPETYNAYLEIAERIKRMYTLIKTDNPYWHTNGLAVKDPEGGIVILSNEKAPKPGYTNNNFGS